MNINNSSSSLTLSPFTVMCGDMKRTQIRNNSIILTAVVAPRRIRVQSQQSLHSIHNLRNNSATQLSCSEFDYKTLTSRSSVKNLLISLGSKRNSVIKLSREEQAAILIQSHVRRLLVMRKYEQIDRDKTLQKIELIQDIVKRRGGDYPIELYNSKNFDRYILPGIKRDLEMLVEVCRNKDTPRHISTRILTILFMSLADPLDFIDEHAMGILLADILLFPFQKTDIFESAIKVELPKSPIYLNFFLIWFYHYNDKYPIKKKGYFEKIFSYGYFSDLPSSFICHFSQFRSCLYDFILTCYKLEKINPNNFRCKYCNKQFVYPLNLGKHIVKYHGM